MECIELAKKYREPKTGPRPAFRRVDLLRALDLLQTTPLARGNLARHLKIGEGSTRSILRYWKNEGLLNNIKRGITLTPKGVNAKNELHRLVPQTADVEALNATANQPSYALLVRGERECFRRGTEQRDAAVREGAQGATTLYLASSQRWHFVGDSEYARGLDAQTESVFNHHFSTLETGDVLILCFAVDDVLRERGAWAALLSLHANRTA